MKNSTEDSIKKNVGKLSAFFLKNAEKIITFFIFLITYSFIFAVLNCPSSALTGIIHENTLKYIFSNTTLNGGDTGSQVYIPYYLKQIFPLFKWWSPDWYSGFPFLYFYPPLMYIITVLLSYAIPINIAFKIITISAVLIFPVASYFCLKLLSFKFPIPALAALFSVFFIFLEKYTIYGGNLLSTFSGQFSHAVSIALLFIFIGLFVKNFKKEKYVATILIGTAVILTHPISGLIMIFSAPFLFFSLKGDAKSKLLYISVIYFGIFLLSSFWTLSFVYYKSYSGTMTWAKEIKWDNLFPSHWLIIISGAAFGIIYAIWKKETRLFALLGILAISCGGFFIIDNSSIWNTRFLPYISLIMVLIAAYFWGSVSLLIKKYSYIVFVLFLILISLSCLLIVRKNIEFAHDWFRWNYTGYQEKSTWPEIDSLFVYLKNLPHGRVMWEYNSDYDKYGTSRILETIPVFTGQPTYEGLLIESSISGPFHFINQTETSEKPSSAIAGFIYPPFDFNKGVEHLKMSGASYFIAYSIQVKTEANNNPSLTKLKDIGSFSVYSMQSDMVEPVRELSVQIKDNKWQQRSIEWYKENQLYKPIVFAKNQDEQKYLENFNIPIETPQNAENIKVTKDSIEFDVPVINQPYLVKISYFPTWIAKGAKGPYLVSPAYMLVIPTEKHVELYFSYGWIDWLGIILTGCGIIYLVYIKKINQKIN